jgi:hypothetical protein
MRGELADAESRVEAIRQVISGLEILFPDVVDGVRAPQPTPSEPAEAAVDKAYPRGREAVLAVLGDSPGVWLTVQQVADDLAARGWPPDSPKPEDAVRATLARIAKLGEVERGRFDGRALAYRLPATGSADRPLPDTPDVPANEDDPAPTGPSSVLREKGEPDDHARDHRGHPPVASGEG